MQGSAPRRTLAALATGFACLSLGASAAHAAVPAFEPAGPLFGDVALEAISVSPDGKTLAGSDPNTGVYLIDITDPGHPAIAKQIQSRQTGLAYTRDGKYLLVVDQRLNSTDTIADEDKLRVLDAKTLEVVRKLPIPGGDQVEVSPDGKYAAIADEQTAGYQDGSVVVVDMNGKAPAEWTTRVLALPERNDARYTKVPTRNGGTVTMNVQPEFVDIRPDNVAVVSLQDQNAFAVVDLVTGAVRNIIGAGSIATTTLNSPTPQNAPWPWTRVVNSPRFPDAVAWLPDGKHFIAASEGENDFVLNGVRAVSEADAKQYGGRGYTVYDADTGGLVWDSGQAGEMDVARRGFYPLSESDDAGQQYEGVDVARFGDALLGFVVAERGDQMHIVDLTDPVAPKLSQIVATGSRPEYAVAVPERGLVIASGESGGLSIYQRSDHPRVQVVPEDLAFGYRSASGAATANPSSLTWDPSTGRMLFNTLDGALSVDVGNPLGPNAKRLGAYTKDALPDGDGGYWVSYAGGRVEHLAQDGTVLRAFPTGGSAFGGVRIGNRTYSTYFDWVTIYDLETGTSPGHFVISIPGRDMRLGDAEATADGGMLFAVGQRNSNVVEIYALRDVASIPLDATVTPQLVATFASHEFRVQPTSPAYRFAVDPKGQVWISTTGNTLQAVGRLATDVAAGAGGTVPATLALTLGPAASFGAFTPGVAKDYTASTTANVISTAGDAALSVSGAGGGNFLMNGTFALPSPLVVELSKASWSGPVSNDPVTIAFKQHVGAGDALRTGAYSKTLTFTLSTTAP